MAVYSQAELLYGVLFVLYIKICCALFIENETIEMFYADRATADASSYIHWQTLSRTCRFRILVLKHYRNELDVARDSFAEQLCSGHPQPQPNRETLRESGQPLTSHEHVGLNPLPNNEHIVIRGDRPGGTFFDSHNHRSSPLYIYVYMSGEFMQICVPDCNPQQSFC